MDGGVRIGEQRANDAGVVFEDRVAGIGGTVRLLGDEGQVKRDATPPVGQLGHHSRVLLAETGRIGEQVAILAEGGGVLLEDGQLLAVVGIDDRDGREGLRGHAHVDGGKALLLVAAEQVNARGEASERRDPGGDVELVGVGPAQRRVNGGIRTSETRDQRALIEVYVSAEAVRVSEVQVAAGQGRAGAGERTAEDQAAGMRNPPGEAGARRDAIPGDQVRAREVGGETGVE